MTIMLNKRFLLMIAVVYVVGSYFQHLMYFSYKVGLLNSRMANGIEVKMTEGWFPLLIDGTFLGVRLVKGPSGKAGMMLSKINWWMPGANKSITIVDRPPKMLPIESSPVKHLFSIQQFRWGKVYLVESEKVPESSPKLNQYGKSNDYKWIVIVEKYNLIIFVNDIGDLNEIVEIKMRS
jgi:hypothetical protein